MKKFFLLLFLCFCYPVSAQTIKLEFENNVFELVDTVEVHNKTSSPIELKLSGVYIGTIPPNKKHRTANFAKKVWDQKYEFSTERIKGIMKKLGTDTRKQEKTAANNVEKIKIEIKIPKMIIICNPVIETVRVDNEEKQVLKAVKVTISGKNIKNVYEDVVDID